MTLVLQLLNEKGHGVWSIHPDDTVYNAIKQMAEKDIGSLVVQEEGRIVGIITERHYARNVVLRGRSSKSTPIREIMATRVVYARPERSVEECLAIMTQERIRHLPVMEDGRLIGIISIGDLVKSIIAQQKFIIDELTQFIAGER
jgi:CBS domain-containing protein